MALPGARGGALAFHSFAPLSGQIIVSNPPCCRAWRRPYFRHLLVGKAFIGFSYLAEPGDTATQP